MSKKAETVADMEVDDILELIKTPDKTGVKGKCTFIRKIEQLPENLYKAITIACENPDVTNREILAFVNTKTDAQTNLTAVQDHRHRDGCVVCLYGTAR